MKYLLFLLATGTLFTTSCSKDVADDLSFNNSAKTPVTFAFTLNELQDFRSTTTRSDASIPEDQGEDIRIKDINIYLWDENNPASVSHYYQQNTTNITTTLSVGSYQIRIVANVGCDLELIGNFAQNTTLLDQLHNTDLPANADKINIFATAQKIEIPMPGQAITIPIELKRLYARAYLDISVDPSVAASISLVSVQVRNIPTSAILFEVPSDIDNYPNADQCTAQSKVIMASSNRINDKVYLFENLKPDNTVITVPSDRGDSNAPAGATYVHIIARSNSSLYSYLVFLGENSTSNFRIRRNTSTQYQISITGKSTADLRVFLMDINNTKAPSYTVDLLTYPTTSNNTFDWGEYRILGKENILKGKCYAKILCDQYSLDGGATWINSDKTSLVPLTADNNFKIQLQAFTSSVSHPQKAVLSAPIEFYYGDQGNLIQSSCLDDYFSSYSRRYGYNTEFIVEGLDDYADLSVRALSIPADAGQVVSNKLTTTGSLKVFFHPAADIIDSQSNFVFFFYWPATYDFLGFWDKNNNRFDPGTRYSATSWTNTPNNSSAPFWREHNQGSGTIYIRFEKKQVIDVLEVTTTPLTLAVAQKENPFTINISGSGTEFTGTVTFTSGTGVIKKGGVVCSNSFSLNGGENNFTLTPTTIGSMTFNITIQDNKGTTKTLCYILNVEPLRITITHIWMPDATYKQFDQPTPYHAPFRVFYKCKLSDSLPVDLSVDYRCPYSLGEVIYTDDGRLALSISGGRIAHTQASRFLAGSTNPTTNPASPFAKADSEASIDYDNNIIYKPGSGLTPTLNFTTTAWGRPATAMNGTIIFTHYIFNQTTYGYGLGWGAKPIPAKD